VNESPTGGGSDTVCAVIVTHNRRELLVESLEAVLGQSRRPDGVLVVDNASDDGSREMLAERFPAVEVLTLTRNEGGAGGFHEGISKAHAQGYGSIWLMDDDTVPNRDALEGLLAAREIATDATIFASKVIWSDGQIHPMNRPFVAWGATERMIWAAEAEAGLVPLRAGTFVSMLLPRETVDRFGLPEKRYFIWSDDIEYTARVLRDSPGFLATRSIALHKTATPHTAVESGNRFYFHVRNSIYMFRGDAWTRREKPSMIFYYLKSIVKFLRHERFSRAALVVVARGFRDAFRPPVDPAGPYLRR
jgi:GT2 family glycosyltransferase